MNEYRLLESSFERIISHGIACATQSVRDSCISLLHRLLSLQPEQSFHRKLDAQLEYAAKYACVTGQEPLFFEQAKNMLQSFENVTNAAT